MGDINRSVAWQRHGVSAQTPSGTDVSLGVGTCSRATRGFGAFSLVIKLLFSYSFRTVFISSFTLSPLDFEPLEISLSNVVMGAVDTQSGSL